MALIKNTISIDFIGALDQKSDSKYVLPGSFLSASNVVYSDNGLPRKRYGFTKQTITPYSGTIAETKGDDLVTYKDTNKALLYLDNNVYSYIGSSSGSWAVIGEERNVIIDKEVVYLNQSYPVNNNVHVERIGDIDCVVYSDSFTTGKPVAQVDGNKFVVLADCEVILRDRITDQIFFHTTTTTTSPSGSTGAYFQTIDISDRLNPTVSSPIEVPNLQGGSNGTNNRPYRSIATYELPDDNSRFLIGVWFNEGPTGPPGTADDAFFVAHLDATGSATNIQQQLDENTTPGVAFTLGTKDHNSGSYWFTTKAAYDAQLVHLAEDNSQLWGLSSSFEIKTIKPLSDGTVVAVGSNALMTVGTDGSEGTITYPVLSGTIVSEPFEYDGKIFSLFVLDGDVQTYSLMDLSGNVYSIDSPGSATGSAYPVNVLTSSASSFNIYSPYKTDSTNVAVASLDIEFSSSKNPDALEFEDAVYRGGSYLKAWDDFSYREAYFLTTPQIKASVGSGTGLTGTYLYKVVLEYLDVHGKVFRSAPSNVVSITLSNQVGKITLTGLKTASKQIGSLGQSIRVKVFRTVPGGTVFYLAATSNSETTSITDTTLDSALTSKEILYTQGGELANDSAPSSNNLILHRNRLWTSDEREIWYSKPLLTTEGPGFSLAQTILAPQKITGLASLDDKLIAFSRDKIYFLFGEGPDSTGLGDFSSLELITSPVGCIDHRSIIEIPAGICFQSKRGIWLLDRALQVRYIGSPLEDMFDSNSVEITSATLVAERNEVRFSTKSRGILVYNFEFNKWSIISLDATSTAIFKNEFNYLTTTGSLWAEKSGSFVDNDGSDQFISQKLETGWIQFNNLAGRERIYEIQVHGDYKTPHYVTASIYYNEDDSTVETQVIECNSSAAYPLRIRTGKQKISSFKISLQDSLSGATPGEGAKWQNMTALVGMKKGLRKKGIS